MAKHIVKCRKCGVQFDTNVEEFVCPSKNFYYHKSCYEDFRKGEGDNWEDLIYDFIAHDLKKSYNFHLCEAQRKKLLAQGRTNKGIYFALRYFYLIKGGEWDKGNGGIGIVEYVYDDSAAYWSSVEARREGILKAIEQQALEKAVERRTIGRRQKQKQNRQKEDFDEL